MFLDNVADTLLLKWHPCILNYICFSSFMHAKCSSILNNIKGRLTTQPGLCDQFPKTAYLQDILLICGGENEMLAIEGWALSPVLWSCVLNQSHRRLTTCKMRLDVLVK